MHCISGVPMNDLAPMKNCPGCGTVNHENIHNSFIVFGRKYSLARHVSI